MTQDSSVIRRSNEHECSHVEPVWPYGGRGHLDPIVGRPAIQVRDLLVRYCIEAEPAIRNASLEVPCGQRVALVGHNGAGKSTLLKTLAGLIKPQDGRICLFGNPVGACHHRTAYLPQRSDLDWKFPVSVYELVMTGRYVHLGWFKRPKKNDKEFVDRALRRLGIDHIAQKPIDALSGGQQQRTLLARALAQESSLFLLDEPLNALDEGTRDTVDEVLSEHTQGGGTVLVATHDLGRLTESFDRVIYMSEGCVERIEVLAGTQKMKATSKVPKC